jgi:hypothetical protein
MSAKRGIDAVLGKLQQSIEQGDYYGAQQMYKTLHFRYSSKKQYEDLVKLLTQGSLMMLQHEQVNEGSELALLLVQHYKDHAVSPSTATLDPLIKIFNSFPATTDSGLRRSFVKATVIWSSNALNNNQGAVELHDLYAAYYQNVDKGLAEKHFLRGNSANVPIYVDMLVSWSAQGMPSEIDLFLARAVLQYLCLSNIKDANALLKTFLDKKPVDTPLVNFLRFVIEVVQHDAYPLFQKLRTAYAASLQRDPNFSKYLDLIGKIYYNVEPQSNGGMGGLLSNMMRSFMGGDL